VSRKKSAEHAAGVRHDPEMNKLLRILANF
jgi:hypothetical protein